MSAVAGDKVDAAVPGDCSLPAECRIEDVLAAEGLYVGTPVGVSMLPMLRQRRDTIAVVPAPAAPGRLAVGDVALYRRGDAYVLHRVVGLEPGGYTILGDNCLAFEHVSDGRVIGVLAGFWRGEREVDMAGAGYRAYVAAWRALTPARRAWLRARGALARGPVGDAWRAVRGRARGGAA